MAYDRSPRPYSIRIGNAAKQHMEIVGLTQAQVAAQIGRDPSFVSERLNGKRPIDTDILDAIAHLSSMGSLELIVRLTEISRD